MNNQYHEHIKNKSFCIEQSGITGDININDILFPFQKDIVTWSLRVGKSAIFADTGLGKTFMQLEWAKNIDIKTGKPVLIYAPLCVAQQTILEGNKLGLDVNYCRYQDGVKSGINITNYEMLGNFDMSAFSGVVLDESSIIKHQAGKTRAKLIDSCLWVPYKLCCSATPSPNDHMELGNQAEFLNVMTMGEMLSMFFIHDGKDINKWRLKGHGAAKFWEWMASWSVCIKEPSDIGYNTKGFVLPPLDIKHHSVSSKVPEGYLVPFMSGGIKGRNEERRDSISNRVNKCAEILNNTDYSCIIWCHLNEESKQLRSAIKGSEQIVGSDSIERKTMLLNDFLTGKLKKLITKPSIAGFGLNWQHCSNMVFVGVSDSWEQYYQAIRRCYRYGQQNEVKVSVIHSEAQLQVIANLGRKEKQSQEMSIKMIESMRSFLDLKSFTNKNIIKYNPTDSMVLPSF